jgi:dethiobiotin synthetase
VIRYFVTGTDTDAGKTHVGCALARRARLRGHRVFAWKPIETGCGPLGPDQEALAMAAGDWQQGLLRGIYRFALPAAPWVAAQAEAAAVDLERIAAVFAEGAQGATVAMVEGAGGWRVPITEDADMGTLASRLGLPVIVVGRAGLGTINHTLLTTEAIERDGAAIRAVVLSMRPSDDAGAAESNRAQIERRWGGRVVVLGQDPAVLDELLAV